MRVNRQLTGKLAVSIALLNCGITPFDNRRAPGFLLAVDPVTGSAFGIGIQRGGVPVDRRPGEAVRAILGRDPKGMDGPMRQPTIRWHAWDEKAPRFWEVRS